MKIKPIYTLPVILFIIVIFFLIKSLAPYKESIKEKSLIGTNLPELTARSLLNYRILSENINDKKYILHIFSSWCDYCLLEHQKLVKMYNKYKIPIYGIAIQDTYPKIKQMLSQKGNPFKDVALDQTAMLSLNLGVKRIPSSLIINHNIIIDRFEGSINEKIIQHYFKN